MIDWYLYLLKLKQKVKKLSSAHKEYTTLYIGV